MEIKKIIELFKDLSNKEKENFYIVRIQNGKDDFLYINKKDIDFKKINDFFSFKNINKKK